MSEDEGLSVWQVVERARHPLRPYAADYIQRLTPDFVELHGDRLSGDDPALVAGLATWHDRTVVWLGQQKGRNLAERVAHNWGMMHPEGFRKALRIARLAAKFGFPIISLVDTPGAFPGAAAEERGIASAIGTAIMEWFQIPVPVVAAVIGEGGSGGALGLAVADRVLMLRNAT
ncbi:MAG: carboxyl transferase domain-containing protein, partial [Candidatus Dormibacteraceae bacterium]